MENAQRVDLLSGGMASMSKDERMREAEILKKCSPDDLKSMFSQVGVILCLTLLCLSSLPQLVCFRSCARCLSVSSGIIAVSDKGRFQL